jgi:sugar phosphate isomerase/epimerase
VKIGVLMPYSEESLAFLTKYGFGSFEMLCWPDRGDLLPDTSTKKDVQAARERIAEVGLECSCLGWYPNMLDPDAKARQANVARFKKLMDMAVALGVDTVCTFAGRDPQKDIPDNIPMFKKVWAPLARRAEDMGLKIGFENCPMFHYFPFRGINIAYTPRAWERMFEAVDSPALGIEYDPSHLICLGIDYLQIIRDWGHKFVHAHAKDAELQWENVRKYGFLEPGAVRHRMPGLGQVDWGATIGLLVEYGYRGNLDIEGRHDPVFKDELEETGLLISRNTLQRYCPQT